MRTKANRQNRSKLMALKNSDYSDLYKFGMKYTVTREPSFMVSAVIYYLIATDSEKFSVKMEFAEGVRNYAGNQFNVNEIMMEFDKVVEWLGSSNSASY
jgi:hypothetical protein